MIKKEFRSHVAGSECVLVIKSEEIPAPPLGIPKKMLWVLVSGFVKKIPKLFVSGPVR